MVLKVERSLRSVRVIFFFFGRGAEGSERAIRVLEAAPAVRRSLKSLCTMSAGGGGGGVDLARIIDRPWGLQLPRSPWATPRRPRPPPLHRVKAPELHSPATAWKFSLLHYAFENLTYKAAVKMAVVWPGAHFRHGISSGRLARHPFNFKGTDGIDLDRTYYVGKEYLR